MEFPRLTHWMLRTAQGASEKVRIGAIRPCARPDRLATQSYRRDGGERNLGNKDKTWVS